MGGSMRAQCLPGCECQENEVGTVALEFSCHCWWCALAWVWSIFGGEDRDISIGVAFGRSKRFGRHIERFSCHGFNFLYCNDCFTRAERLKYWLAFQLTARTDCAEAVDQDLHLVPGCTRGFRPSSGLSTYRRAPRGDDASITMSH